MSHRITNYNVLHYWDGTEAHLGRRDSYLCALTRAAILQCAEPRTRMGAGGHAGSPARSAGTGSDVAHGGVEVHGFSESAARLLTVIALRDADGDLHLINAWPATGADRRLYGEESTHGEDD